ncbi:MAG: sensor histidine kinase [Anaerolineales bacterium]|nr:sensor histidine kinase [Anaerolineales bacterium]
MAFVITHISENVGMIFCLYFALIGESVGIFKRKIWVALSILFFLALVIANYSILFGIESLLWWGIGLMPLMVFVVLYVSLYSRESTARESAQKLLAELEVANRQLSEYADQVESLTLVTERQRMARELHDTLAQGLAGLILQLEAADSHISAGRTEKTQTIIQQAMSRARTTLADARRVIGDLREAPATPNDLGDAIREEVERFKHTTGINCQLDLCIPERLPRQTAENAIRAIREGLMNIAKHAEASQVSIQIAWSSADLIMEITDDGVGFSPAVRVGKSGHYGLLGMRERTRILGGTLSLQSEPNQGTRIRIELPLDLEPGILD